MNLHQVYNFIKSLHDKLFILVRRLVERVKCRTKVRRFIKMHKHQKLTKAQKKLIREYYSSYGYKNISTIFHQYYTAINGKFSEKYIPDDLFYSIIEPSLNRLDFATLQDKNLTGTLFKNAKQPVAVVKNINGFYFIDNTPSTLEQVITKCNEYSELIIKPTVETGGGKNIMKFSMRNQDVESLLRKYKKDFIIQEVVRQNKDLDKLNPSSLNTLRIITYLSKKGPVVTCAVLRVGGEGSLTDNMHTGGMSCGIKKNGKLKKHAYNRRVNHIQHSVTGTPFKGFKVPNFIGAKEFVKNLHLQVPYFKIIGWDIAIDVNNEPILIEFNAMGQGVDFQAVNGPLLGKYTDEVLQLASEYI